MNRDYLDQFVNFIGNFSPGLKYSSCIGKEVNMLDTTLSVENCKIRSTLYSKPTDAHSYLHYDSCHSVSCKNSIPYSQFLRVRRICSEFEDYKVKVKTMFQHFVNRGYPKRVLHRAKDKVDRLDRKQLLSYNKKVVNRMIG